jgi:hypothetical protein
MRPSVRKIEIPSDSEVSRHLPGSHFHDCYELSIESTSSSALEIYLDAVVKTPTWINGLMAVRNRAASIVGLKNLGHLGAISASKPVSSYRVGDRMGIFSVLYLTDNEVIFGDSDKHLSVEVSVCKLPHTETESIAVSTVVHIKNALGRVYMLFVAPVHKRVVPAMLSRAALGKHVAPRKKRCGAPIN